MGNCNFKTEKMEPEQSPSLNKNLFNLHYIIGKGGFGKVWKVEFKKNKEIYAMKIMSKFKIYQKKSVTSVMNEKNLLENLRHKYVYNFSYCQLPILTYSFIVNIHYAFQDKEYLYLIMDYLGGGDLRYHLMKNSKFGEEKTKFIIACILIALEYIHNKNILHRDIKPENLVFDENGYLRLTDFGISRIWSPKNENDTSGTPGYMAPEVMMKLGHGIACDLFAVGVITYECMLGRRPYLGSNRKEIRDSIIAKQAKIHDYEKPCDWSENAVDFVNKLLLRKQYQRLGFDLPGSAKSHVWFQGFNWEALANQTMISPFNGIKITENDGSHFNKPTTGDESTEEKATFYRNLQIQKLFNEYFYDQDKLKKQENPQVKLEQASVNPKMENTSEKTTKMTTTNTLSKYP